MQAKASHIPQHGPCKTIQSSLGFGIENPTHSEERKEHNHLPGRQRTNDGHLGQDRLDGESEKTDKRHNPYHLYNTDEAEKLEGGICMNLKYS